MPAKMSEASRVAVGNIRIDERLYNLVRDEIAPGTGIDPEKFWKSLGTPSGRLASRTLHARMRPRQMRVPYMQGRSAAPGVPEARNRDC